MPFLTINSQNMVKNVRGLLKENRKGINENAISLEFSADANKLK